MLDSLARRITRGKGPFAVVCQEYVRRFPTREAATAFVVGLEETGSCPYAHQIEEDETP